MAEDDSSIDDETTITRAEIEEGKSAKDELAELEADVDLPIESLLEQYKQGACIDSLSLCTQNSQKQIFLSIPLSIRYQGCVFLNFLRFYTF